MKKHSLIKGTIILGVAGIVAKFLGLFFRWPLIMLIGDEGIGYYQMSYPLYTFFVALASGVPIAISKLVSEKNAIGDHEGIMKVLKESFILMIFMGLGATLLLITFSRPIIKYLRWNDKSYYSLIAIAIAPTFISIMSVFRGFFQGLQNMQPTGMSQIIEQIGRVVVGVGLAFLLLPYGVEYSAGGAALGAAAGGLFAGIYLFIKYMKINKPIRLKGIKKDDKTLWVILKIAIPLSLGATVSTIMGLIDSVLVPQKLLEAGFNSKEATILYGQLTGKANVLVNVPLTLSMALCASIVPIIAEAYILQRKGDIINKVEIAIKISSVIAIPSMLGLMLLSNPIMNLLFPGHSEGYNILRYLAISIPATALAQTSTAILQGTGNYIKPVINLFIGCIVKIIITLITVPIPIFNIYGAVIATILAYMVSSVLNMMDLRKRLGIRINYYDTTIKPAYASVIMMICVLVSYNKLFIYTKSNGASCLIAVFLGIIIYIVLTIVFGVFKYDYIKSRFFGR
ncbi:polysaccharide biosynthesis protein [Clostridium sp. MSJ-4]|uniref:Polysaccharide biosynthesis protein n=1 Tax=Clostridium simiarum TaxID=2841506 RepID=A0ABS6F2I3_9CLOT|nr:polysaccharide biosynthesis protein [Clostridium simiarum]MBU5592100.1 polysaccharide biosynthesis protein [Clostridium simiarum]